MQKIFAFVNLGRSFATSSVKITIDRHNNDSESSYGMVVARYKKYREQPLYAIYEVSI